ncbi:hypothetical protein NQD34_000621 [Periophthalmus magnuspinnatus]|nr:hypothetical protein NQD34_000621 [Periophthalmus magnuspinnatus]
MHLLGITFLLAYLLYANFASTDLSHSDYYDYYEQEPSDEPDSPPQLDMEQRLRSVSTVDELMSLIYPSFWAALKCRSKLSAAGSNSKLQASMRRSKLQTDEPTYAAAYLNLDLLKSIESEWRKTQCTPREVCVDVAREFGAPTNFFYKPPCVSVFRCGGCCHSEDKQCRNISTGYVSKTLFEITVPITQNTKPVTISVANHTQCSCLSKLDAFKQVHSIIRRALPDCPIANRTCPPGQTWSSRVCVTVWIRALEFTTILLLCPIQDLLDSTLISSPQTCVVQIRSWMQRPVSVCVAVVIIPVAQTAILTKVRASASAAPPLATPAPQTSVLTLTPVNAPVPSPAPATTPSTNPSVHVNVTCRPTSAS